MTLFDTEGGSPTASVTPRIWEIHTSGSAYERAVAPAVDVKRDASAPMPFAFAGATNVGLFDIGLSLQDEGQVQPTTVLGEPAAHEGGWLFRSGDSGTALPTDSIEVIAAAAELTVADLPALMPAASRSAPVVVDTQTSAGAQSTVIGYDAALYPGDPVNHVPGGIDLKVQGITSYGGWADFTILGRLVLTPSHELVAPQTEALAFDVQGAHVLRTEWDTNQTTLDSSHPPGLVDTLERFLYETAAPQIVANVEAFVGRRILSAEGRAPVWPLPAGVILSVRSVRPQATSIEIRAALGAFGGVNSKLPAPPVGRTVCPLTSLAALGYDLAGLQILRAVRDRRLVSTPAGRWATASYYRLGDEVSGLLVRHPELAARVAALVDEVSAALGSTSGVPPSVRRRGEALLRDLAALGSPELRAAVAEGFARGATELVSMLTARTTYAANARVAAAARETGRGLFDALG